MIIPYLRNMIHDHKLGEIKSDVQKIQISMRVNFISSKDTEENRTIYVLIDNEDFMFSVRNSFIIKS